MTLRLATQEHKLVPLRRETPQHV